MVSTQLHFLLRRLLRLPLDRNPQLNLHTAYLFQLRHQHLSNLLHSQPSAMENATASSAKPVRGHRVQLLLVTIVYARNAVSSINRTFRARSVLLKRTKKGMPPLLRPQLRRRRRARGVKNLQTLIGMSSTILRNHSPNNTMRHVSKPKKTGKNKSTQ
jgi:hypothetical protein